MDRTPDKGPYVELQETINKVQADPMINEFGGVYGTTVPVAKTETVANTLEYNNKMNPLKLQEEWAKWEFKIENVNPEYLDFVINYAENQPEAILLNSDLMVKIFKYLKMDIGFLALGLT